METCIGSKKEKAMASIVWVFGSGDGAEEWKMESGKDIEDIFNGQVDAVIKIILLLSSIFSCATSGLE